MRTIEIPLSGHDKGLEEYYTDYLIKLTKRMHKVTIEYKALVEKGRAKGNMCEAHSKHTEFKDEIERLHSVIYEHDNIMN